MRPAFAILLLLLVLMWLANHSAYFPMQYPRGDWSVQSALGAEDAVFRAADNTSLHAWWKTAPEANCATLFLHGNAGNVTHRAEAMSRIAAAGSSVLVVDYRGYGKSGGRPTERGLYQDAEASYDWLISKGWPPWRIIVHGASLGTTVAVDLASRRPCAGLILEAPFPSARAVASKVLPVLGPLLVWGFDAKSKIARVHVPLLVLHGTEDEVIDHRLGEDLFRAANEPKTLWSIAGAHHNDIASSAGAEYAVRLRRFMMDACNAAVSSPSR